jgi:hypothetical protein
MFELPKTEEQFKEDFRQISEEEFRLRWPAIGELVRIEQLLVSLSLEEPQVKDE